MSHTENNLKIGKYRKNATKRCTSNNNTSLNAETKVVIIS